MTRKEKAMEYFGEGYNCSQSVVLAFSDMLPYDKSTLLKLSSSFGGGMGRLRQVCGAVTGMFIVTGFLYGYDEPGKVDEKAELYEKIQALAKQFEAEAGSIICGELLGTGNAKQSPVPEKRTPAYYAKRPCKEMVGIAAEMLENFISGNH